MKMEIKKFQNTIIERFGSKTGKKEYSFFMRRINSDPKLMKCDPNSLLSVALQVADLGLSLNPAADYVYIIPYGNKAQLQLSYKGLLYLVRRANPEIYIFVDIVYEGDKFSRKIDTQNPDFSQIEYEQGENYGDIDKIKGAFCIWKEKNQPFNSIYMSIKQLEKAKSQSKYPNSLAWLKFPDEMYKKIVLRRAIKMMSIVPTLPDGEIITPADTITESTAKFDDFEEVEIVENQEVTNNENQKENE